GLKQLADGKSFEELMHWCLRSQEFADKSGQFIQTHLQNRCSTLVALDNPPLDVEITATRSEMLKLKDRIQKSWTHMGASRPHHSVLSRSDYLPGNITADAVDRFWASGAGEVTIIEAMLWRHGFSNSASKVCVEYGCGLGRVT